MEQGYPSILNTEDITWLLIICRNWIFIVSCRYKICLYKIYWLALTTQKYLVYCAVRTLDKMQVRSQVSPCEICVRQSGTGFYPIASVFRCQLHSANAPYWPSSWNYPYQKDKRATPGNILQSNALSEIGAHWIEKYCNVNCKDINSLTKSRDIQFYKAWRKWF
jgi:hypothetical protein